MASVAEAEPRSRESIAKIPSFLAGDSLAAGIMFALVFTIGQRAIGFLRSIVFCRLMTDQELGQWSIVWGFIMLLPPLAMLGLPGCFGKYTEYYRTRGNARRFVFRVGLVSGLTTAVGILVLLVFPKFFADLLFENGSAIGLVVSLALTLVAVSLSNFASSLLESIRQVRLVSIMRFIIVAGFTVLGSLAILLFDQTVQAVTLSYGISCLLSLFPAVWLLYRCRETFGQPLNNPLPGREMWKRILPFAGWLWVSNLLTNSIEIADRYMLLKFSTVPLDVAQSYVGQYHSSRIIPTLMTSIAVMLGGLLLPFLSKLWEAGRQKDVANQLNATFKLVGLIFTAGGIVVMMFSSFFFETILQGRYSEGLVVFPLTMVFCTWFSLFTVGQDYLWVAERGRLVSISLLIGLAINIGMNMMLIPLWGLWGAVIAASCANFIVVAIMLAMNHFAGCPTDIGSWSILVLPMLMLLEPAVALLCLVLIIVLACRTRWIFSEHEKSIGLEYWSGLRLKLAHFSGRV